MRTVVDSPRSPRWRPAKAKSKGYIALRRRRLACSASIIHRESRCTRARKVWGWRQEGQQCQHALTRVCAVCYTLFFTPPHTGVLSYGRRRRPSLCSGVYSSRTLRDALYFTQTFEAVEDTRLIFLHTFTRTKRRVIRTLEFYLLSWVSWYRVFWGVGVGCDYPVTLIAVIFISIECPTWCIWYIKGMKQRHRFSGIFHLVHQLGDLNNVDERNDGLEIVHVNFFLPSKNEIRGKDVRHCSRVRAESLHAESFSLRGGVREKRAGCERSCVSLARLFTWRRIRRGRSRKWKGERWTNRQKHGFSFGERVPAIVPSNTAFQNVSGACLPDKRSRGKKRSG